MLDLRLHQSEVRFLGLASGVEKVQHSVIDWGFQILLELVWLLLLLLTTITTKWSHFMSKRNMSNRNSGNC